MKILIVADQYDNSNNGTTVSARRFVEGLRKLGHTVLVAGCGSPEADKYVLKEIPLPIGVSGLIHSQGMTFARPEEEVLRKAIQEVDVVHFYMPFFASKKGLKIAEEYNIPHTTAFHVQPENITYSIGLGTNKKVNDWIYHYFRDTFYNHFTQIHCPSQFIAEQLKEHGYTANLNVISNGIQDDFCYNRTSKPEKWKDKYVITMIGRYSNEKRQDVLIEAVKKSKYADRIQLVLAGKGPEEKKYAKLGRKLKNPPIMQFFDKKELLELLNYTDLYVHSSDAEIEAISCIEAFACGNVPIIANSTKSATPQFALHENSLFIPGDTTDLAKKIDFWIENPEEKEKMGKEYATSAKNYKIEESIQQIEGMFQNAIFDYRGR